MTAAERLADFCVAASIAITVAMAVMVLASPAHAGSQRDFPTTRFYTANGSSAGTATTYGNTTKFYAPNGSLLGTATTTKGNKR